MAIDKETARRVAHLARIEVEETKLDALAHDLSAILGFMEQLNEVDIDGVEPMTSVVDMSMRKRKDEVTDGDKAADITANAPVTDDHFFLVPKVVE